MPRSARLTPRGALQTREKSASLPSQNPPHTPGPRASVGHVHPRGQRPRPAPCARGTTRAPATTPLELAGGRIDPSRAAGPSRRSQSAPSGRSAKCAGVATAAKPFHADRRLAPGFFENAFKGVTFKLVPAPDWPAPKPPLPRQRHIEARAGHHEPRNPALGIFLPKAPQEPARPVRTGRRRARPRRATNTSLAPAATHVTTRLRPPATPHASFNPPPGAHTPDEILETGQDHPIRRNRNAPGAPREERSRPSGTRWELKIRIARSPGQQNARHQPWPPKPRSSLKPLAIRARFPQTEGAWDRS